jgi:DNA-binding MarR family transcriptional regulator
MNGTDVVVLDEQAGHLLRRAHQRASAIFLSELSEAGLTPAQFFAMARLHEMGDVSQNQLGRLVAMDPATIQGVVHRLINRGLLRRKPDPKDKRRMIPRLTPAGRRTVIRLMDNARRVDDTILEPLAPKERTQFLTLLKRLV